MRTDNLDLVLSQLTAAECSQAADEEARHRDAGLVTTQRHLGRPDSRPSTPVIRGT